VTQPSKGAAAFLFLFGLPFLGGGLFFIFAQLISHPNFKPLDTIVGVLFALVFVGIGGGLMFAAIAGYARLKKQAALADSNPTSPWLWRQDWAARRADSQNKKSEITYWILALFCGLIVFPITAKVVPQYWGKGDPRILLPIGFSLIGAILVVAAVRRTMRHRRFGDTYFEFDALPFSPGERVSGRIHLRFETRAEYGIDLRLQCVRMIITGSGDSRSTSRVVLWQADKNVPSGAITPGPLGRAIPVDFELPADCLLTNQDNSSDQVVWTLHAQADVPGVDYSDDFELPVFRTAASQAAARDSQATDFGVVLTTGFPTQRTVDSEPVPTERPSDAKVIVSMHSGGTEFYFPPLRNPGRALILFLATVVWSAVVYALYHSNAPIFFFSAFGFCNLLLILGTVHVTFGSARIGVGNGEILSRRGFMGMGATRRIPISNVESILPIAGLQQGGNSNSVPFTIRLRTKDGRKLTLADEIVSRQEARWVVSQVETLAGLKVDAHIEVDLPLGTALQPPQGMAGQPMTSPPRRTSSAGSLAIFALLVMAMFGWQAWRMTSFRARSGVSRANAAARTKTIVPRIFSHPLTDADVERVMALPAQQQAEELLERAIGHDERALQIFSEQLPEWVGRIRMTERMTQLERRSQYSKDLRVRYANVDLNLALQGWHTNEEAVAQLMDRARTDAQHRAWAVYYLGMLAARDVDYDRIHEALLDYARNDKDPVVRMWAVEGMRFLAKDEVLDELFISFTEDPANAVRDRAGCNLSDCGIFTRKQRMRMVPKFLDLATDPRTTPQMRSWSFLALQEITDESLPADAMAWSRWYEEHGAEKMAAFERLDWWQVRGDE